MNFKMSRFDRVVDREQSLLEGGEKKEKKKLPENVTQSEGLKMISKQSISPILGTIFHPSYMMMNVKLLGLVERKK